MFRLDLSQHLLADVGSRTETGLAFIELSVDVSADTKPNEARHDGGDHPNPSNVRHTLPPNRREQVRRDLAQDVACHDGKAGEPSPPVMHQLARLSHKRHHVVIDGSMKGGAEVVEGPHDVEERKGNDQLDQRQAEKLQEYIFRGQVSAGTFHVKDRRMEIKVHASRVGDAIPVGSLQLFLTLVRVGSVRLGPAVALLAPILLLPFDELDLAFSLLWRGSTRSLSSWIVTS